MVLLRLTPIVDATVGLRVSEENERGGLDLPEHGETGHELSAS